MAKLVLKKYATYAINPGSFAQVTVEYAIIYDTNLHTIYARDFRNDYQYTRFKDYDLSLIFAYNPSLQNNWANVQQATQYDIAHNGGGTVEIQQYCDGEDGKTVTTTGSLTIFSNTTLPSTDPAILDPLYLSRTTQAGACAVVLNDLEIENIYLSYSGSTVDINISASGTNTPLTYCLFAPDSSTCQAGATFSGIDASTDQAVEIWVKDSAGYTRSETVVIKAQANYGTKYIVQFYNRSGELCEAKIQKKGYSGAITYPDSNSTPVQINYKEGTSSDAKYDVIKGSECIVSLISESSFEYSEIFESEEDGFRLQYYVDSVLMWQGFAKNEGYQESYTDFPYEINITFIDGIGTLKDKKFVDSTGEIYSGIKSELEIIKICLLNTLHELPIWVNIDIYENNHLSQSSDTDTPLDQTYVNLDAFNEDRKIDSCYDVLQKILFSYGAQLFQEFGAWNIRVIDDIQNAYSLKKYSAYGVYSTYTSYNPNLTLTAAGTDPLLRLDGSAGLNIIPAFRNVVIEQQLQQRLNVIKNGDFELFDRDGRYSNWNDVDSIYDVSAITDGDESRNTMRLFGDAANDINGSRTSYVYADPQLITVSKDGTAFNISFSYMVRATDSAITNTSVKFKIQVGLYLLKKDGSWTNDSGLDEDKYLFFDETTDKIKRNEVNTFNLKTSALPDGGNLQFWVYRALGTGGYVDSLEVTKIRLGIGENEVKLPKTIENESLNSTGTYTYTPDAYKLYFSDFLQFDNAGAMIKNQKFLDAQGSTPTSSWFRFGVTEASTLQGILGERILSNFSTPTQEIQCKIHSINTRVNFSNVINDPNNSGKKFMIGSLKIDEKEQISQLTMLEILSADVSEVFRIMEDGRPRIKEGDSIYLNPNRRILES